MHQVQVAVLTVVFSALTVSTAVADTDDVDLFSEDLSLVELMDVDVVTASKRSQKVSDAPATVWAFTREQIQQRGYQSLDDLLEDVPEIEIQRRAASETNNHLTFRGISGNEKFIILMDGFRINSPTGSPHVVGTNFSLANAKRVEVILGPASALYGADAFSGIINIITRDGSEISGVELDAGYGLYNTTHSSVNAGYGWDDVEVSVTGDFYYSDEPDFPDLYPDEFAWYLDEYSQNGNTQLAPYAPDVLVDTGDPKPWDAPTISYFLSARMRAGELEVGYSRNMERHTSSMAGKPEFNIYSNDARFQIEIQSMYLLHNHKVTDDFVLQTSVWHGTYEMDPSTAFVNTFSAYNEAFKYASAATTKFEEQVSYKANSWLSIVGGVSFQNINSLPKSGDLPRPFDPDVAADIQDLEYIGTDVVDVNGNSLAIPQDFYYLEARNLAGYTQATIIPFERAELTVGGRFDYNTRYGGAINPRAGLVVQAHDRVKLKFLYGEAFLSPSPYKAYQHYGAFVPVTDADDNVTGLTGPFWHLPNPELDPEKLRTAESSVSWTPTDNIIVRGGGFFTAIQDLIVVGGFLDDEFKGVDVGYAERPVNRGDARMWGGTARIDLRFQAGPVTIEPRLAYSYVDGRVDGEDGDKPIPYAAKHTVKTGLDVVWDKLSVAMRGVLRTETKHLSLVDDGGDLLTNDSFFLLRAFVRYRVVTTGQFEVDAWLRGDNLLNSRYYNVSYPSEELFTATPQDPLRVLTGVSLRF